MHYAPHPSSRLNMLGFGGTLFLNRLVEFVTCDFGVIDIEVQVTNFAISTAIHKKILDFTDNALTLQPTIKALLLPFSMVRNTFINSIIDFIGDVLLCMLN